MAALPRVLTVDPTGRLSRIARAAIDLSDLAVVQVDVPGGAEALEELRYAPCTLMISALAIDGVDPDLDGVTLATRVKRDFPLTAVMVLADNDEGEDEITSDAPFLYLKRPLDAAQVMRIINAALNFRDIFLAAQQPTRRIESDSDMGALPPIDPHFVQGVLDTLSNDILPMAIILISRAGEVIAERGAVGYIDRELLAAGVAPTAKATISMSEVVGTQPSALNFFDGDRLDIFTLSVGFHYTLCIIFDGLAGQRQFGAVNRFGRRAVEDLLAILGTHAYALDLPTQKPEEEPPRRRPIIKAITQEMPIPNLILERAQTWEAAPSATPTPTPVVVAPPLPAPVVYEPMAPIADFDVSVLDGGFIDLEALMAAADDLFDMDKLAEIADEGRSDRGPLTYEEARQLGILP
ncbi:MAG: hypothetical protein SGJ24_10980 [Chloroflexota bacterium]|nr:hypothetical protein [Chloroflexota bacterium]